MPKFGRPSVAAFAAFHPLCAADDPPASDAGAASASMRVAALLPLCAGIMVSLSARVCSCGAVPPFQAWPSAGDAASALSVLATGAPLRVDDVSLPDTADLAPWAGVATLAVGVVTLASCAATAILASCPATEILTSCAVGTSLASDVAEASLASWPDVTPPITASAVAVAGGVLMTVLATMAAATGCAWASVAATAAPAPDSLPLSSCLSDEGFVGASGATALAPASEAIVAASSAKTLSIVPPLVVSVGAAVPAGLAVAFWVALGFGVAFELTVGVAAA